LKLDKPSLETLIQRVDSRYTLAVMAAKRARKIVEKKEFDKKNIPANKPVSIALYEIAMGKVNYKRRIKGLK